MKALALAALPALALAAGLAGKPAPIQAPPSATSPAGKDRSPADVALSGDGRLAVSANRGAGTISLVELASGRVLREVRVGEEPFAVAFAPGDRSVVVSNWASDSISVVAVSGGPVKNISVGHEPRGLALSADGKTAFVALGGADAVAQVDIAAGRVVRRLAVGQEPWHVALTPDGRRLLVGNTRSRDVTVLSTQTGKELFTVALLGRNVRKIAVSPDGRWAYVPFIAERLASATRVNIDRGWVVGNRLGRVPITEEGPREAITLDSPGDAIADVEGCALSPDGRTIALAAAGTHELAIFQSAPDLPFVSYGGPGDHIERASARALRRIKLGGAPRALRFTPDGQRVVVANYLDSSLQVVSLASGTVEKTIALGASPTPSLARVGEAIFGDANRSFGNWYSCASCHVEGHTGGGNFDTLNDGGYGKPKKVPSLRGVTKTAPYTWHGWQKSLRQGVHDSFVNSMQGPEPSEADMKAVEAYLATLTWRASPHEKGPASARGEKLFAAKGCDSCHSGSAFTAPIVSSVGLEEKDDEYVGFNPPTLRGVYGRAPYLHDGRAATLEEVLTRWHRVEKLTGKSALTPAELSDLVAYLKTL